MVCMKIPAFKGLSSLIGSAFVSTVTQLLLNSLSSGLPKLKIIEMDSTILGPANYAAHCPSPQCLCALPRFKLWLVVWKGIMLPPHQLSVQNSVAKILSTVL